MSEVVKRRDSAKAAALIEIKKGAGCPHPPEFKGLHDKVFTEGFLSGMYHQEAITALSQEPGDVEALHSIAREAYWAIESARGYISGVPSDIDHSGFMRTMEKLSNSKAAIGLVVDVTNPNDRKTSVQSLYARQLAEKDARIADLEDVLNGLVECSKSVAVGNGLDHPTIGEQNFTSYLNEARKALKGDSDA